MADVPGLRERKKIRTRQAISEAAISLFMANGFDNVSVAEVAAAADVSKMTVFNYFPAKEDLVLLRVDDHLEESASVVRGRDEGQSPIGALRAHFLRGLKERDVITGLNDDPQYLAFQRMVIDTPSLRLRLTDHGTRMEDSLDAAFAEVLGKSAPAVVARIAASQVIAVQQTLVVHNLKQVLAGKSAKALYPHAVTTANLAYDMLDRALAGTALVSADPPA